MNKTWSFLLLVSAVLVAGCSIGGEQVGGVPRKVVIHSIVSLSPSTTELSMQFGFSPYLKGRTQACNYPESVVAMVPVVAGVKPDYEKIKAIGPELILADNSLYSAAELDKVKELGQVFVWDPKTVADYEKKSAELSAVLGLETGVSKYMDQIEEEITNAKGRATHPVRVALVLPDAGGKHLWAGTESFYADELRSAAFTAVGPKGDKYLPLDPEEILKDDPDFIFLAGDVSTPDKANQAFASFAKDPRLAALKAVKDGNVRVVNQDLALRAGGRVENFIKRISQAVFGGNK